jgi:hypothetical protein
MEGLQGTWKNQVHEASDIRIYPAVFTSRAAQGWYFKKHGKTTNRMKHYKTPACKSCSLFERCTNNKAGRLIERTEHAD